MPMVHQRPAVGKLLGADIAGDGLVAMRLHVALEARLIVERFAAFAARMVLLAGVLPRVLHEGARVTTLFAAQAARVAGEFGAVHVGDVSLDDGLLDEGFATEHTSVRGGRNG